MKRAQEPQPDNRYRVHRSALVYGLNLYFEGRALTLSFQEAIERVVYVDGAQEFIVHDTTYRPLRSAAEMVDIISMALGGKNHSVRVLGTELSGLDQLTPHEFFLIDFADRPKEIKAANEAKLARMLRAFRRRRQHVSHVL